MNLLLLFITLNQWIYTPNKIKLPSELTILHESDRVGLLTNDKGTCFVVHRGTWSFEDLFYDLESEFFQQCNEFGVMKAFYDSYEHDFDVDYMIVDNDCKEVYYTGHSLGGVTVRMAAEYADHRIPITEIVTFGEPRMCCTGYTMKDIKSTRYINGFDPIPALPSGKELNHCTDHAINLITNSEVNDISYPSKIPRMPIIRLMTNHRVNMYKKSVIKYINNLVAVLY